MHYAAKTTANHKKYNKYNAQQVQVYYRHCMGSTYTPFHAALFLFSPQAVNGGYMALQRG